MTIDKAKYTKQIQNFADGTESLKVKKIKSKLNKRN